MDESEMKKLKAQSNSLEVIEWQVEMHLPAVGVSLIGNSEGGTSEIVFAHFNSITFAYNETNKSCKT